MSFKKGIASVLLVVISTALAASPSSGRQQQRPAVATVPAAVVPKKDGPNFDQQRLIALFGSEAQPVYGNRDPATGRVVLASNDPAVPSVPSRPVSRYVPPPARPAPVGVGNKEEVTSSAESQDPSAPQDEVDRKDTRVPETNEINPFELLPPQFHDLLNIPIHDYGNGTTYNPYDKYKVPSKSKYPLVSTGYANTKYQGSPNLPVVKLSKPVSTPIKPPNEQHGGASYDYDYDSEDYAPIKVNQRPVVAEKAKTTTTTIRTTTTRDQLDDDYSDIDQYPTTKKQRVRPSEIQREPETVAVYRPNKPQLENTRKPVRPSPYDDNSDSSIFRDQVSTYRPVENRPAETKPDYNRPDNRPDYNRPEYRPSDNRQENRPDKRPTAIRPSYTDYEFEQTDDWPQRPSSELEESKPSKPVSRPDGFSPYKSANRPKPEYDADQPQRPIYSADDERSPVFTPHQSYRPHSDDQMAEIKVTPKPFYAANENQNYNQEPPQKTPGQVEDEPDIIYDYDDERSKGEGVLFMFDNSPSTGVASGPDTPSNSGSPSRPVTPTPAASPYPTVASREPRPQPAFSPAFRPSAPVRPSSEGSFLSSPPSQQGLPIRNPPQQKQQPPPQFGNSEAPRPPFRFPSDQQQQVKQKENQPPNILPLFRPNTNPTDEFQFIKHPQQVEFQRQQPNNPPQLSPGQLAKRPLPPGQFSPGQFSSGQFSSGQEIPQRQHRPAGVMSPLPSALQTPFSSISQAVANFFGRRSGQASGNKRSGDLNPTAKMDRFGLVDATETEADLDMAESNSGSFVLFSRPDQPLLPSPISVDRSGLGLQHPAQQQTPVAPGATHQQVVGIRAPQDAANGKPPAFYVYTSKELEQGKPPYLVVGPVLSGPPNVAGAKLVHTAPAKPIPATPESQRRNDFPSGDPNLNRPPNPNSLPSGKFPAGIAQDQNSNIPSARQPDVAPVRKPFFPISSSGNKPERPLIGLSPPRQQSLPNRRPAPGFIFPEIPLETDSVLPQGISPISQGIPPPRVPLNPQKDVASLFSNPTLLHNRPSELTPLNSGSFPQQLQQSRPQQAQQPQQPVQQVNDQGLAVKNPDSSAGVASVLNVPLYEETSTPRPLKRKTTKSPSRTTTPIYMEVFNNHHPVTYATIQQEDGKQIAVVHPAYIVTYKGKPGPPELLDLDAPFVPSVESPSGEGELSSIPFEKWHAMPQEIERKGDEPVVEKAGSSLEKEKESSHKINNRPTSSNSNVEFHGGFQPVNPNRK